MFQYTPDTYERIKIFQTETIALEHNIYDKSLSEITPLALLPVFDRYDSSINSVDWEMHLVGVHRADNRHNQHTTLMAEFEASTSGTWEGTLSTHFSGGVEINAAIAKVSLETGYTATISRSWTAGQKYGAALPVPPQKVGYIYGYKRRRNGRARGVHPLTLLYLLWRTKI